jgi:uncharacterized protein (TIGR03000 family)
MNALGILVEKERKMKKNVLLGFGIACLSLLLIVDSAAAQRHIGGIGGFGNFGGSNWGNYLPGGTGYGYSPNYGYSGMGWGQNGYYGQQPWTYGQNWQNQNWQNQAWQSGNYYGQPMNQGYAGYYTGDGNTNQHQSFYSGPGQHNSNAVTLHVRVRPDAQLWIEGQPTQMMGPERTFMSPPLQQGEYRYTLKAAWNENGRQVTKEKHLKVSPGHDFNVSFLDNSSSDEHGSTQDQSQQHRQSSSSQQDNRSSTPPNQGTTTNQQNQGTTPERGTNQNRNPSGNQPSGNQTNPQR